MRYAYLDLDDKPKITDGHKKDLSRKIKNLINEKVYESPSEVMEEYDISSSAFYEAVSGRTMTVKGKWVFCYLDESGKPIIEEGHKKGLKKIQDKNKDKYGAWHINDEERERVYRFPNLTKLCRSLKIKNRSHVKPVCEGERSHVEHWRIAFLDGDGELILYEKHLEEPSRVIRPIICLNDEKIFDNANKAACHYQILGQQILRCAKGEAKTVYRSGQYRKGHPKRERLKFAFVGGDGKPILTKRHKESLSQSGKHRVFVIKTKEVYASLAEFRRVTGISDRRVQRYLESLKNDSENKVNLFGNEFILLSN